MKRKIILAIIIISSFLYPIYTLANGEVKASFPEVKPLEISRDKIWFAIKTEVSNQSDRESVCVTFQALDYESFEIDHVNLCDKVPLNGVRILTKKTYMPLSDWKRINRWRETD